MSSAALLQHFPDPRALLQAIIEKRLTDEQRDSLRAFLLAIEVPDCKCPLIPACKCQGQCKRGLDLEHRPRPFCKGCQGPCRCPCKCCDPRTKNCGCLPELFQPPCQHILACQQGFDPDLWATLLEAAWPRVYRSRRPDPVRRLVLTPRGRLARIIFRYDHRLDLWRADERFAEGTGAREEELLSWTSARDEQNRPINPALESSLVLEEIA